MTKPTPSSSSLQICCGFQWPILGVDVRPLQHVFGGKEKTPQQDTRTVENKGFATCSIVFVMAKVIDHYKTVVAIEANISNSFMFQ